MGAHPRRRDWGDGTELEGIEDLEVDLDDKEKKSSWSRSTKMKCESYTPSPAMPIDQPMLVLIFWC